MPHISLQHPTMLQLKMPCPVLPCRRLIKNAFAAPASLPDYLSSSDFYKFAPAKELISLPGDIARTEFRLVATLDGWEYTMCERQLPGIPDPERKLLVTVRGCALDSVHA